MEPAYIIHSRPYGDTSLVLELFARNHGRMSLLVRGARTRRKKPATRLQPFEPLLVSWVGRGELKTGKNIEHLQEGMRLSGEALMIGLYVNELLYYLLGKHEEQTDLFVEYHELLSRLSSGVTSEAPLRRFEISLLQHLGYGLSFDRDIETGKAVLAGFSYTFTPDAGFVETGVSSGSKESYPGEHLLCIAGDDLTDKATLKTAKKILRQAIAFRLGGKQLKSRSLFGARSTYGGD